MRAVSWFAWLGDIGDNNARALARERQRRGAADAARGAGDERDLAHKAAATTRRIHLCVRGGFTSDDTSVSVFLTRRR